MPRNDRTSPRRSGRQTRSSAPRQCSQAPLRRDRCAPRVQLIVPNPEASRTRLEKNPIDPIPREVGEQPAQARLGPIEVQIMAEPCSCAYAPESRLFRIDLPWMEIEYDRLPVKRIHA